MGTYYANIDNAYTGTGHTGTEVDPFTYDELNTHSSTNPSGNTYNIKGTAAFSTSCGSSLAIHQNTFKGWDIVTNGPWRVSDNAPINIGDESSLVVKDGIFHTSSGDITVIGSYYNCIFLPEGDIVVGQFNAYGCSFYGLILTLNEPNSDHIDDCFIESLNGLSAQFFINNCVTPAASFSGTNITSTDCQFNWSIPAAPTWNGSQSSFYNSVLGTGVTTPPEPGYGSPTYTNYETGLWGESRTGIGAVYFDDGGTTTTSTTSVPTTTTTTTLMPTTTTSTPTTDFYANINNAYEGTGHLGTEEDPFSYVDLNNHSSSYPSGNTYYIKGKYLDESSCGTFLMILSNTWRGWDLSNNGPWRIANEHETNGVGISLGVFGYWCYVSDGIFNAFDNQINVNAFYYNCLFICGVLLAYDTGHFYGCSLYGELQGQSDCDSITAEDCFLKTVNLTGNHTRLTNCAIETLLSEVEDLSTCQVGWTIPATPVWDGTQSAFNNSVLSAGTITPPQPGNPPYTNYETGLWGEQRTGIGAVYFNIVTTTTTSTTTTTTSTTVVPTTTSTTVTPTTTTSTTVIPTTTTSTTTTTIVPTTTTGPHYSGNKYAIVLKDADLSYLKGKSFSCYITSGSAYNVDPKVISLPNVQVDVGVYNE